MKTGELYFVEGLARSSISPSKQVVIYSQNYRSSLRDTNIIVPEGSMWTRDPQDFQTKFEKVPEDNVEKLFGMIRSSLVRWLQEVE